MNIIDLENISSFLSLAKIDDNLKSNSFHILKMDSFADTQLQNTPTFSQNFFQITFSIGFTVNCKVDDTLYNHSNDFISFGMPNQVFTLDIKKLDPKSNGYIILFEQHFLKILNDTFKQNQIEQLFRVSSEQVIYLNSIEREKFKKHFDNIYREFDKCSMGCDIIIQSYLLILLQETARLSFPKSKNKSLLQSREQQILQDFKVLLEQNESQIKNPSYYSDKLNLSTVYLNEVVKKLTRKSVSRTIKMKSLLKAKTYLLQTNLTVSEVAFNLGFEDASNFTRFFKKETGITPSKFKSTD